MAEPESKRVKTGPLVSILFGQEVIKFPSGVTVKEVIEIVRHSRCNNRGYLIVEAIVNGDSVVPLPLPDGFPLEDRADWEYRARAEVVVARRFAAGHAIQDAKECYYVQPRGIDGILRDVREGKYCVICDRRQSGKTTTVHAISRQLQKEGMTPVYIGGIGGARSNWVSSTMWRSLCMKLYMGCTTLFRAPRDDEICTEDTFSMYFHKTVLGDDEVLLILDEADSLLKLPVECLDEFFHAIRNIKSDSDSYRLKAIILVGVETVKDLLEGHYDRRQQMEADKYSPGSTPSRLSPFPHDHIVSVSAFELQDIVELMQQANMEHGERITDVEKTATSIWQLTMGHKGLVGTCLAFLMQEEAFSHERWLELVDSYKLGRYVFGQATYYRMMMFFIVQSRMHFDLLASFLAVEEINFDSVAHLRDLLAEGVLTSRDEGGRYVVRISSPLLRTAILRRCSIVDQQVDTPPDPCCSVNRPWVICEAIRTLDAGSICRPECQIASGGPSEYAHQFMFMCRIKAVLQVAYPFVGAVVLPEVKETGLQRSRLRLDTLVRDHQHLPRFGFEFLVDGTRQELERHNERAVIYSQQHSAQVYLVHFAMDNDPLEIQPSSDSVYSWAVRFDSAKRVATVRTVGATGDREEFILHMKNWTGKFCFEDIV